MIDRSARPAVTRRVLLAIIGLALVGHVRMVLVKNVSWDEFWFLSFVYDYARGTLAIPLQSVHVHAFRWLTAIGGQEVDQVIAARAVMLLVLIGTFACVYRLARRAASVEASWFAVLCCAGYSNILRHGSSFRTDGLSVFLLMAALVLVQSRRRRWIALAAGAVLVAMALLVTIKSVLFLPTIGVVLLASPSPDWRAGRRAGQLFFFLLTLIGATLAGYLWHAGTLAGSAGYDVVNVYLRGSAGRLGDHRTLFPEFSAFEQTVRGNVIQWGCIVGAAWLLARDIVIGRQRLEACAMLALTLPLLSLPVYKNAFPYFYVFIMPPALVLCAVPFDAFAGRSRSGSMRDGHLTALVTIAIGVAAVVYAMEPRRDGTRAQRDVIRAVHEMFPQPVPYIDRNGMIASFPKVGFFMSEWGLEEYRARGTPVFAKLLRTERPKLLVANFSSGRDLFKEDAEVLRTHFVHAWGPLYVAGMHAHVEKETDAVWDVLGAGRYRVQSVWPVTIAGAMYLPGSLVSLPDGPVTIHSSETQDVILRASEAGPAPTYPPPDDPLYTGFGPNGPTPLPLR